MKHTIVLIEDNEQNLYLATFLLEKNGCQVVPARSGPEGIELADSFVFNPHKWMFTNFDCSAYFVRDKEILIRTFEICLHNLRVPKIGLPWRVNGTSNPSKNLMI